MLQSAHAPHRVPPSSPPRRGLADRLPVVAAGLRRSSSIPATPKESHHDQHTVPPPLHPRRPGPGGRPRLEPAARIADALAPVPRRLLPRRGAARRPRLAVPQADAGATVGAGRPARRQPGARRTDGPASQAAVLRADAGDGLQGDRGRLPVRVADRLRLRAAARRDRAGPGGRDHRRVHGRPPRPHRAHRRVRPGDAQPRRHPPLHRDGADLAGGRARPRPRRADRAHPGRRPRRARVRRRPARRALRVLPPRSSISPNPATRWRSATP